MKLLIAILVCCMYFAVPSNAQTVTKESLADTVPLSAQERVDTLVKYVRKRFYGNDFGKTIEVGQEALRLAKKIEDRNAVFRLSSLMGNAFLQLDDTIQAKRIFFSTVQEAERLNDTTRSLTTARIDLGNLYAFQEKEELALLKYKEALPLAEKLNDSTHLFILHYSIAQISLDMEDFQGSEHHVNKTNIYAQSVGADAYHAVARLNTGRLNYLKEQYEVADTLVRESIELAKKSNYTEALIEAYDVAAQIQIALQNYEPAVSFLREADTLKGEKYKKDKIRSVEIVTAKFKLDQLQNDLTAQELQNEIAQQDATRETTILWIKIAAGILAVFSIFLFISYLKRKRLLKNLIKKNQQYLEAKEESEAQVEAKNKLFSNITHELRTPMYGIIGISDLLMDDKKLLHQKENLNSLKFSAEYLLSFINNVLQFTKGNKGGSALKRVKFDLRHMIEKVVESSKFLNTSQPNEYRIYLDKSIPGHLMGDDIKVSQVLMNLLSNAAKFTQNGLIEVSVVRKVVKSGQLCLHFNIKDNGVGMKTLKPFSLPLGH
ncbi:MAG: histidine kinase dimerization/phospho-acceptor domain-containing protein [Bacteroidota bacterium]